MSIKIGINGFGRIGRLVFRAALCSGTTWKFVGINDPFMTPTTWHICCSYDTMHGQFQRLRSA